MWQTACLWTAIATAIRKTRRWRIWAFFASLDPVALDQACVDAVYRSPDPGKAALIERMESRNGIHTVETAAALGLGSREYELITL